MTCLAVSCGDGSTGTTGGFDALRGGGDLIVDVCGMPHIPQDGVGIIGPSVNRLLISLADSF